MAFNLTPNVNVHRDAQGRVRELSHLAEPYKPAAPIAVAEAFPAGRLTPRMLADQYLQDVAPIFGFAPSMTANFAAAPTTLPTRAGAEMRFKEEKSFANSITVAYDQTHLGLPVWDAGVVVRLDQSKMQVTSSHNAAHYDVDTVESKADAPYMPNRIDVGTLTRLLGLSEKDPPPAIHSTRLLIYRYRAADRFDPQILAHQLTNSSVGLAGAKSLPFPTLPLAEVPDSFVADRHYVVTEVLFAFPFPSWGLLNWRVFIHPDTGVVLYLRALVSCARGSIFTTDPVSVSGNNYTAASDPAVLDALRATVMLAGLGPIPEGANSQQLHGEFVALQPVADPPIGTLPSEQAPFDFIYPSAADNFSACSAYHHCDSAYRLVQSMGINVKSYFNNTVFPVPVDPHALAGQINAMANGNANGNGMGSFVFGSVEAGQTMGIAADARVVLHEFGHALLWDHVSSPNFGFAHSAGDSLGAILNAPTNKAPDPYQSFPFIMASSGLDRRHDRSVADGWAWGGAQYDTQYRGEQILSTTLFRIYRAAGGDSTSLGLRNASSHYMAYLIIKACGLLSFTSSDPNVFVTALTDADASTTNFEGFAGGAFRKVIRWSFEMQGLFQPPGAAGNVTTPGAPPAVDVYIDDGRGGVYMPYSDQYEGTPELWNRLVADGGFTSQAPQMGVPNFLYFNIKNRGTAPAAALVVSAFQSKIPNPQNWPNDWKPVGASPLKVSQTVASGGSLLAGPIAWTPEFPRQSVLVSVTAAGDVSNVDTATAGTLRNAQLVSLDNNIAQRTF